MGVNLFEQWYTLDGFFPGPLHIFLGLVNTILLQPLQEEMPCVITDVNNYLIGDPSLSIDDATDAVRRNELKQLLKGYGIDFTEYIWGMG